MTDARVAKLLNEFIQQMKLERSRATQRTNKLIEALTERNEMLREALDHMRLSRDSLRNEKSMGEMMDLVRRYGAKYSNLEIHMGVFKDEQK